MTELDSFRGNGARKEVFLMEYDWKFLNIIWGREILFFSDLLYNKVLGVPLLPTTVENW